MKGKLYKMVEGYILSITDDGIDDPYGITNPKLAEDYGWKLLSISNCDEIFGVVDVDKLAMGYDLYEKINFVGQTRAYIAGFNKAMELNKDKVFTLEDIYDAVMLGVCFEDNGIKGISTYEELKELAVKRASKPTEIEVEIIMSPCYYDTSLGGFSTSYTEGKPIEEPKLDKDGCMILKRV
jgi:hypothetical protein